MTDGDGKIWTFEDKSAVFDEKAVLRRDTRYPVDIELACTVVCTEADPSGAVAGELLEKAGMPWFTEL